MEHKININKEDTLNILKNYYKKVYDTEELELNAYVKNGYSDYCNYEPDQVEFTMTLQTDLGLGIGISDVTATFGEDEALEVIKTGLQNSEDKKFSVTSLAFNIHKESDYRGDSYKSFGGIDIQVKPEVNKNIGLIKNKNLF